MKITMVKKRLASGEDCDKCQKAEQLLRERGLWEDLDEIVWAIEGEPDSEGMQLSARLGVAQAPFFLISSDEGGERVYRSVLQFAKDLERRRDKGEGAVSVPADFDLEEVIARYKDSLPQEILEWGLKQFGEECAIAFSGAEDVVLIDMASRLGLDFSVFCLDTGRLHPETYQFIDKVRKHYGIEIRLMSPNAERLEAFVREKGLFSFYEDGHKECCGVRKVEPLKRALSGVRAWVTGQRRDQSPDTRAEVDTIQIDPVFAGREGEPLVKLNPLAGWTSERVWRYIRNYDVPFNALHERGFISIGCEPCTRSIRPNEHERAGRWWWEEATKRECGLHLKED